MVHASLDSAKSLFEKLTNSQGFAPQSVSSLVSSAESFRINKEKEEADIHALIIISFSTYIKINWLWGQLN